MRLLAYFWEFIGELYDQLERDDLRWGDEWKTRPIEANAEWDHQVDRVFSRIQYYYHQWKDEGYDFPWLKVCGNCFIGWVHSTHPYHYMKVDDGD